ncbi:hypothetical protein PHSY_005385 [Pseudozyma hubeiensis SY62]|uniref:Xylanolytic transcriptional activator regulatory domain-containing protein n=1 Tax=Pseudozyma hubeiensis (strain SY62) TaxID=1305764 RepID=R9P8U6_PSEHS|nr:hypothetical protein PHSY_005385 [Pseudozyma hubeiensis SY62]GAC97798.1 hypothetical protein PHSY_005385 [Pseudozyma hubeiensis SY62]
MSSPRPKKTRANTELREELVTFVEALEQRMATLEQLIASLAPGVDFTDIIGESMTRSDQATMQKDAADTLQPHTMPPVNDSSYAHYSDHDVARARLAKMFAPYHAEPCYRKKDSQDATYDEEAVDDLSFIQSRLESVAIHDEGSPKNSRQEPDETISTERIIVGKTAQADSSPLRSQFYKCLGSSCPLSALPLIAGLSHRSEVEIGSRPHRARQQFWHFSASLDSSSSYGSFGPPVTPSWPAPDLADQMVEAYFSHIHRVHPIVNEAHFRHEYSQRHELRNDVEWLVLCYSVFMFGSRHVVATDAEERDRGIRRNSDGKHWWQAVQDILCCTQHPRNPLRIIQALLLSSVFQAGIPISASTSWSLLGTAICMLLDMGAHRKVFYKRIKMSRLDKETFRRNFWIAYSLDRETAALLGRPVMLRDEDISVDLPLEVSDARIFSTPDHEPLSKQSDCRPSSISAFVCALRLDEIIGFTLRSVYSLHRTKVRMGFAAEEFSKELVQAIDKALEDWFASVPTHLRFDANGPDNERLTQSCLLYTKFYNCKILLHRPFVSGHCGGSLGTSINFSALNVCTDAARSITQLTRAWQNRGLQSNISIFVVYRMFSASTILLIVIWHAKRTGRKAPSWASQDLRHAVEVFRSLESQWQFCGKAVDMIEWIINLDLSGVPTAGNVWTNEESIDDYNLPQSQPAQLAEAGTVQVPAWSPQNAPAEISDMAHHLSFWPFSAQGLLSTTSEAMSGPMLSLANGLPQDTTFDSMIGGFLDSIEAFLSTSGNSYTSSGTLAFPNAHDCFP